MHHPPLPHMIEDRLWEHQNITPPSPKNTILSFRFQGYGQEQGKVFTNPSLYGEHQNMGRKQVTALGCLLGFMLISQFVYRAPELGDAIMTRDSYVVSQQYYDFLKVYIPPPHFFNFKSLKQPLFFI